MPSSDECVITMTISVLSPHGSLLYQLCHPLPQRQGVYVDWLVRLVSVVKEVSSAVFLQHIYMTVLNLLFFCQELQPRNSYHQQCWPLDMVHIWSTVIFKWITWDRQIVVQLCQYHACPSLPAVFWTSVCGQPLLHLAT